MSKATRKKTVLFLVDFQIDFCMDASHPLAQFLPPIIFDIPVDPINDPTGPQHRPRMGALYVGGALGDSQRIAKHLTDNLTEYDDVWETMDCHQAIHIAHPIMWVDKNGKHPEPFTIIKVADLKNGTWRTTMPAMMQHGLHYVEQLAIDTVDHPKRYDLCIWPPHCRVGSLGCSLMPEVDQALNLWETSQMARVNYVPKGNNWGTEHYSGIQADVPDPNDETTKINLGLIKALDDDEVGCVRFAVEALSHCGANTITDIINNFGSKAADKLELVGNCSSNVYGFQAQGDQFLNWFTGKGGKVITV